MMKYIGSLQATGEKGANSMPLVECAQQHVSRLNEGESGYRIEVCEALAGVVNRSLRYKKDVLITPEEVAREQVTNCYGYTTVISELLATNGIKHYIAIANQHAFAIVTDDERSRPTQYLVDPLTPRLNGDVTGLVTSSPELMARIDEVGIGATRFDAYSYVNNRTRYGGGYDRAAEKHGWLKFGGEFSRIHDDESLRRRDARLLTNLYDPRTGVAVLENYSGFLQIANSPGGDIGQGLEYLRNLEGVYPDIDYRNKFSDINKFVQKVALSEHGTVATIEEVIETFDKSLEPHKEASKVREWKPDTYRKVGARACKIELIDKAISLYAAQTSHYGKEKLAKAQRIKKLLSAK